MQRAKILMSVCVDSCLCQLFFRLQSQLNSTQIYLFCHKKRKFTNLVAGKEAQEKPKGFCVLGYLITADKTGTVKKY
jgi:hypothetical protein